jgi:hypothetical protein
MNSCSHDARCRCIGRRLPELAGDRLEVLHDGGEVELVSRPGETAYPRALELIRVSAPKARWATGPTDLRAVLRLPGEPMCGCKAGNLRAFLCNALRPRAASKA